MDAFLARRSSTDPPDRRKLVPTFQKMKHWYIHSFSIRAVNHVLLSAYTPLSRMSMNLMWTVLLAVIPAFKSRSLKEESSGTPEWDLDS